MFICTYINICICFVYNNYLCKYVCRHVYIYIYIYMYLRLYNLTFYRRAIWSQCTCAIRVTIILFNWDFRPFLLRILAFWCHQYYRVKTVATILWGKKETHFEKKLTVSSDQFQAHQITDLLVPFQYLIWAAKNIGNNGRSLKPWCLAMCVRVPVWVNKFLHSIMPRTTLSQDVQTWFPVQLAFSKFLSKIEGNFWGSAVSMILALY